MKATFLLHWRRGLLMLALLGSQAAQAQGPLIDPTFQRTAVFKPASVEQVLQQPDGKRIVLGSTYTDAISRAGSQTAGKVVRLLANSNDPDSVFTRNVRSLQGQIRLMILAPNGQVLLIGYNTLTLGAVARQYLLRLNADGTPDASFDAGFQPSATTESPVFNGVAQPDGKLVLTLMRPLVPGAGRLVRLLPNGTLDTAFQAALTSTVASTAGVGGTVVLQPDGKLLLPGGFGQNGPMRLLPSGALDASFAPQMALPTGTYISQVALQPDGKVLVAVANTIMRLTATGALDPTFQSIARFDFSSPFPQAPQVQVQSDGKLIVNSPTTDAAGAFISTVVRLLPSGALDTSFSTSGSLGTGYVYVNYTQILPNGQLLVVRQTGNASGLPLFRLVLLNPNGSVDPSLVPRIYANGQVNDVVQLPNGSYLVGGNFTEINGVAAGYVARLSTAGVPDPAFGAAVDGEVRTVRVQPDGKVLIGGTFEHIAGVSRVSLARLLPSGALDTGFAPPFFPTTYSSGGGIRRVELLPDGRVLAAGGTKLTSAGLIKNWLRVMNATTGQPDLTWPPYQATDVVVQPNGKIVVAGFDTISTGNAFRGSCIFRLLPSGALDPIFTPMPSFRSGFGGGPIVSSLTQSATGSLYLTGYNYIDAGPPSPPRLYALQPDGQPITDVIDNSFARVTSLAVQPNGRLLVGTDIGSTTTTYGISRLMGNLTPDPSFIRANGPLATVNRILVQPDGAILAAGSFTSAGGQAIGGLVRLLDANVLRVSNPLLAARTQAWPVPAHGQLHLALDAASRPQRVELLDALGRVALAQPAPQAALTLDTAPLAPGVYLLRVHYATSPMARRVVLE